MLADHPTPHGPRARADLDTLPAYKAGARPAKRADLVTFKVSSNENPYPPLPSVLGVIGAAAKRMNRYPDPLATDLVDALSRRFDVPRDDIAVGTGSVAVCGQLVESMAGPGDEVLYAWRSFEAYPIWTQIAGARSVTVPLRADERHDLPGMAAAVTDRTRLVFVCSPNNPTGTPVHRGELDEFLDRIPSDVLVVIDEAYREFVRDPDVPDGLDLYRARPNVAVLRTFSKAYGLAGLRVGFAVAPSGVADYLRRTAVPFGVSTIAQEAAIASLAVEEELLERVDSLAREREQVRDALVGQGWTVARSQANFVWLRLGSLTDAFALACDRAGVTVRPFPGEGVRITVAEPEANSRVLAVAREFLATHRSQVASPS